MDGFSGREGIFGGCGPRQAANAKRRTPSGPRQAVASGPSPAALTEFISKCAELSQVCL